jgi:protein-tyrosine phosphatase
MHFFDIHCHLVPGIDDGAKSLDESLAMARLAVEEGIGTIICTPHQCGNSSHVTGEAIRDQVGQLQSHLDDASIPLKVLPGADVRIEPGLVSMLRNGRVVSLADRMRHVLLELPHEVYLPLEPLLGELRSAGVTGILSHPERNAGILARPEIMAKLVDGGCLTQVTAGSLNGTFGPASQQAAEQFVSQGLVHFIATDAHGARARRPLMRQAYNKCVQLVGERAAQQMCCHHPAAVAAGGDVPAGRLAICGEPRQGSRFSNWFRKKSA